VTHLALNRFRILAAGHFCRRLDEEAHKDLRALFKDEGFAPIRRGNRFIHLAVLAAERCRRNANAPIPKQTASYLATAHGCFADTVQLLEDQLHHQLPVTPFRFVNVLSNIAGFHVADRLALEGENIAISREYSAYDAALEAASLGLALGSCPMALVGSVDEADETLSLHRHRTATPATRIPGEGSAWLLLSADDGGPDDHNNGPRLIHQGDFKDCASLNKALADCQPDHLAAGPHGFAEHRQLAETFPGYSLWDYHQAQGWIWSNPAMAFAQHVASGQGRLAHVDRMAADGPWRLWILEP